MEEQHLNIELSKRWIYICEGIDLSGKGIEIAPFYNPILPKKEGYGVETIDVLNKQQLMEKYKREFPESPQGVDWIEEVDYIWTGESYEELTGKSEYYDYAISSNLVEHVPDLLAHLKSVWGILKMGGIYSMAIPDKRYTFDFFRNTTDIKDYINLPISNNYSHARGSLVDCTLNTVNLLAKRNRGNWEKYVNERAFRALYDETYLKGIVNDSEENQEYKDIHESVFTPASFELLINDFKYFYNLDFEVISMEEAYDGGEFYVKLKKVEHSKPLSLQERVKICERVGKECIKPYLYSSVNQFVKEHVFKEEEVEVCEYEEDKSHISIEYCKADSGYMLDNVYHVSDDSIFTMAGWAIDTADMQTFRDIYIRLQGICYRADFVKRSDVRKNLCRSDVCVEQIRVSDLGFEINIPAAFMQAQKVGSIEIVLVKDNKNYYMIDTGFRIVRD